MKRFLFCLPFLFWITLLQADEAPLSNWVYVKSTGSNIFMKALPQSESGSTGKTQIYLAHKEEDQLLHEYPWYSQRAYLAGDAKNTYVVRHGALPMGREVSHQDLALAFYKNGKLIKKYSQLDLAGSKDKASFSETYYQVLDCLYGFQNSSGRKQEEASFAFKLLDGRHLVFSYQTKKLRPAKEGEKDSTCTSELLLFPSY